MKLKVKRKNSDWSTREKSWTIQGGRGDVKDIWYSRIMFGVLEAKKENSSKVILRK